MPRHPACQPFSFTRFLYDIDAVVRYFSTHGLLNRKFILESAFWSFDLFFQVRQNPKIGAFYVQGLKFVAVGSYKEIEKRTDEGKNHF